METLPVRFYAAFAADEGGGDRVAVVLEETPLWPAARQRIAADLNAPVTAFARRPRDGSAEARFHSAHGEVAAGASACLGLFTGLKEAGWIGAGSCKLQAPDGAQQVEVAPEGTIFLPQPLPVFEDALPDQEMLARALGLAPETVAGACCVRTDRRHLLLEVRAREALSLPVGVPAALSDTLSTTGIALWCRTYAGLGTMKVAMRRVPRECEGETEDEGGWDAGAGPVAGPACGALAAALLRSGKLSPSAGGQAVLVAEQGADIGRPAIVRAVVNAHGREISSLSISGFAALRLRGEIIL